MIVQLNAAKGVSKLLRELDIVDPGVKVKCTYYADLL